MLHNWKSLQRTLTDFLMKPLVNLLKSIKASLPVIDYQVTGMSVH